MGVLVRTWVWLYTANRLLTVEERQLPPAIELFLSIDAHGQRFELAIGTGPSLVIALDERSPHATGCSIDAKVRWLQALGQEWGIDWLSRSFVTYYIEDASSWQDMLPASFWAARKAGVVDGERGWSTQWFPKSWNVNQRWCAPSDPAGTKRCGAETRFRLICSLSWSLV